MTGPVAQAKLTLKGRSLPDIPCLQMADLWLDNAWTEVQCFAESLLNQGGIHYSATCEGLQTVCTVLFWGSLLHSKRPHVRHIQSGRFRLPSSKKGSHHHYLCDSAAHLLARQLPLSLRLSKIARGIFLKSLLPQCITVITLQSPRLVMEAVGGGGGGGGGRQLLGFGSRKGHLQTVHRLGLESCVVRVVSLPLQVYLNEYDTAPLKIC